VLDPLFSVILFFASQRTKVGPCVAVKNGLPQLSVDTMFSSPAR